jgi:hypothetical protein
LLFDLPAGSPRKAGLLLAARVPSWLEGSADWLTGSFGGLVLRSLPGVCIRTAAVVGTLPGPQFIRRRTKLQVTLLGALPPPVVEVAYRNHLRRSLVADGLRRELVARITRRGLAHDVLMERLGGVLRWEVGPEPIVPFATVLGSSDSQSPWRNEQLIGDVIRVPGGHRPWCSNPEELLEALRDLWSAPQSGRE